MLKVLIVEQSVRYKQILCTAVESTGIAMVEYFTKSVNTAREVLSMGKFDVVLLDAAMPRDMIMPTTDGIGLLREIKSRFPDIKVIMTSNAESQSASTTINALSMGAIDFIIKSDTNKIQNYLEALFQEVRLNNIVRSSTTLENNCIPTVPECPYIPPSVRKELRPMGIDIVVIAASTGGPLALETVCSELPENFDKPILVVQHMPPDFTKILANSLDNKCPLKVVEGNEGDIVKPGQIIIAPGGIHMIVTTDRHSNKVINLQSTPLVNCVRPAADVLFNSIASAYEGRGVIAVVLTGMGKDGQNGVEELKRKCNCHCITQSEKTCVVYGMPRAVDEVGLSDESVDLQDIARRIQNVAQYRG